MWGDQYELLKNVGPVESFLFFIFLIIAVYGLTNDMALVLQSCGTATQCERPFSIV